MEQRVAGEIGRLTRQKNLHSATPRFEVPRHDESVAAVVALAAAEQDGAGDPEFGQPLGRTAARVLHEYDARNAVLLDRAAVEFSNLSS